MWPHDLHALQTVPATPAGTPTETQYREILQRNSAMRVLPGQNSSF